MTNASTGAAVTTGTPTVYYTLDGGAQATGTATPVHKGNGEWSYPVPRAETNAAHGAFTMVLANAVSVTVNEYFVFGSGNTYYVNPTTGNDGNDGLSSGAAWQTIVYALTQISDGDSLMLADGTYSERIVANGVYETPVTVKAQNYKGAIIQFSSNNYCWEFDGGASKNWIIEGVDFKPTDGNANGAFVRFDDDCENITFKDVGLTPPDDGGSTANGFQNAAAAKLTNIVFDGVRGDLANQMGFARLTGQVKNVRVVNSRITRHTTGLSIDDMSGEFYIDRSRLEGSDTNIWIRTPNQSGGEAKVTVGDHCTLVSSTGYGVRVTGSAAYMPTLDVGSCTIDSAESSIYAEEYIQGGSIRNTTAKSNGSTPAVAISADGATNYVGHFDIDNLKCRNLSGHGLLIGQNCVGANIRRSNVHGGDQGVVLKGENILFADNDATSETGSAILLKGAIDTVINNNRVNMNGTSGTIRGIDVREQDAGVLDQRNPDRILISNNDINVSGSAAIGYYLDATNIGNDIREDGNRIQTKDSAVAANILGTAVADSASWNAAYAAYAITNNGVFSTINQVVAPTPTEIAAKTLKYGIANVENDADCEEGSLAEMGMATLNGDISEGPLKARRFGNDTVFKQRTRSTDTTNERTVRVGPDV